jgi:YVTN family beta-propeller protein
MFYYAGLVFNRGFNPHSAIVVSRLIDLNNKENADPNDILNGDAIQYISTSIVATGSSTQFLDKPTMAVDIPRAGANTCNLTVNQPGNGQVRQSFAAGNVYVAYTAFSEAPNTDPETVTTPQPSKIYFVRSTNCGASWSRPVAISGGGVINQGAVITISPVTGIVYVGWRQFHYQAGSVNQPDAIAGTASIDGGQTFAPPIHVSTFTPFDEGTTNTSFRTNAYPTAAVDGTGRIYVAYSARNAVPSGDARIVLTTSLGGLTWTPPVPVDNPPIDPLSNPSGRGHQIMPTLTFAAGRLSLLYYDLRLDHTFGLFSQLLSQGQPTGLYSELPALAGELGLTPPLISNVFNAFIDDSTISLRRHTFDLRVAQALPGKVPLFAPSVLVSQYAYGCCAANQSDIEQLQFNVPNLPIFRSGTAPFMGDYLDIAASPSFIPPHGGGSGADDGSEGDGNNENGDIDKWTFNIRASTPTTFHAAWTDNRDVQAPANGDWTKYTPPNSPSIGSTSIFQPGTSVPACQVGFTGSRNQNIYTAPISGGLVFGAPGNTKQLGTTNFNGKAVPFQRAFSVVAQNATNVIKSFRLNIVNQPVGGNASFLQFAQLTTLDVSIPPLSSATRPVFATSTNPTASITVTIAEITAPTGSLVPGGLTGSTMLNPDVTNPAITNPAITNPAITNPAITNFEVTNPAITNPAITNPAITNPAITNPAITNPAITNSTFQNVSVVNPAITNPAITNPAITNASIANPAITNPAITNVNPANTSVSDTQWTATNTGNTEGSFAINLASSSPVPGGNVLQLIISKLYQTPAAPTGQDCNLKLETHNVVVTNIVNPVLLNPANPAITNPGITNPAITNATVALAPGETANIIIRVVNTDTHTFPTFNPAASVAPVVVAQAVPTLTVLNNGGGTPPPPPITVPPLQITTSSLPDAVTGAVYAASIQTIGGNPTAHTFSLTGGSLPTGLSLDPVSGAITGIVTASGVATFSFSVQVQDVGSPSFPQHTATQSLSIRVGSRMVFAPATLPSATQGTSYSQNITVTGGIGTIVQTLVGGNLPPGLTLSPLSGLISGIPTASGPFSFTVQAADSAIPPQIVSQGYTINVVVRVPANVTFVTQPGNSTGGQALGGSPVVVQVTDNTGAVIPNAPVTMSFAGTPPCSAATLSGTLSQTTNAQGQTTFNNLSIDHGQLGYTLRATSANATTVSNPFAVNGFCATAAMGTPRELGTQILLTNGKVLIAGGVNNTSNALNTAELYDPTTDTVSATGNSTAPNGRKAHMSVLLPNGQVLLAGGVDNANIPLATAELYDPASGTFSATGSMSQARGFANAVLLADGRVLVSGGFGSSPTLNTAEVYDPATGSFTPTGNLNNGRSHHTGTLLPDGTVLIAGGRAINGPTNVVLASAEIFDPAANSGVGAFTSIGSMNSPRDKHTATLLPNGTVLLTGGFVSFLATVTASNSSAEIFDPATTTFTLTGSMSVARAQHTASLSPDGSVLVAGGVPDTGATTPSSPTAEIFNPATGTFTVTGSMTMQRELAGALVLLNGNPLISGGDDGVNTTANEEIYYSTAAAAPLIVTTTSLPNGIVNQAYRRILLQQGGVGSLTWALTSGALPAGMTLGSNGILTGTPTATGSFPFTVQVADSSSPQKTASASLTLVITNAPPLVFRSTSMPTAVVGQPYVQALPVAGGTQPYNATVTSGTLPPGLTLSSGGVLNGTPTGTGSFTFTATVTDSSTPTKTATQTLTMGVNTLVITTTALPSGIVGIAYNAPINTGGGTPPFSFSPANAAFPPGLLIQQTPPGSSSGALAGTPTLAGTYTFSESVVDSSNPQQTATQNYVVTIAPAGSAVPANVTFVSQPQTSVGGQTLSGGPIVMQVTDAKNTPISGTTVAMTLGGIFNTPLPCSVATLSGTLTAVTDATGRATFSNLSIDRGGFNYALFASTGSASGSSGPFSVKGFCASGNLSTPREEHTQVLLGTRQSTIKLPVDPRGTYLVTGPGDSPNPPLIISLASLGIKPGDVISAVSVGDEDACGVGEFCSGEIFAPQFCGVFSSSNTLLPNGGAVNRVPGAIAPNFTTAFSCNTPPNASGQLPTDIPQDFALIGEPVTVPAGAAYLFVAVIDVFYGDNIDPNRDFGVALTVNSSSSVNGKVLMAGGIDNLGNALNTAELYDPALGFTTPTGNLTDPSGRAQQVSVVLPNGKVLLIGGVSNVSTLATAELYDPATRTFAPTGSMSQPRFYAAGVLLADGRVLVTGGFNTPEGSNTAEIYDPATGLFTPTGNMTQRRGRHAMTLLPNGKVLVTGGRDDQANFVALSSAEIFDPSANQGVGAFTPVGNMNSPRHVHASTLLSDGTVLVSGGFTGTIGSSSAVSAETFDPNTNVFTLTGNMSVSRSRHTSTLLPDGTVLVAAGVDRSGGISSAAPAELYSPTSRTLSPAGPMTTGREFHRATPLLNGSVLLGGGDDGINVLASTEIYYNPVAQAPIAITTTFVPNGIISQSYVQLLLEQGSAGPITWSLASGTLPPGITLGANGLLSGTPTAVGSFNFAVQATDGISTGTSSFTINVSLVTLAFTSNTMPAAGSGKPYSQPLPITGGTQPYNATVTGGTLPTGLALSSAGVLSGTPSGAGVFTFTATVTDSSTTAQTATQTLTIAVDTLVITTTALPSGIVGVPYNGAIATAGGTLPLSFSAATAAFPPGLAIQQPTANSGTGALAGTPTLPGHYTFTESVSDSSTPTQTATQYYLMDILPTGTAVPATVTFLTPPQNSIGGQLLAGSPIRVHVADANNAPIAGASVAISFNGAPPCSSAALSGTLNGFTNGNGNAVFFDLSIDRGQLGYTLLASAGSAAAVSQPFTVNGFCPVTTPVYVGSFAANTLLSNGKALITGGIDASGNHSAVAQLYDPTSQTFTQTGSMQLPRREHTSTLLADGRVLVTGGRGGTAINSPTTATAEIYDPIAGTFTSTATPMNAARRLHSATALPDGTVLVVGGLGTSGDQNTAEIFDPKTNSFTPLAATLATARETHTATLLPDGTVLIAGGSSAGATLSSAEIYNPSTQSFAAVAAPMNSPRSIFNTLLLPTGKALLVGGIIDSTGTIATPTAELYDRLSGTFKATGSMSSARAFFTANLLPNGQVLVEGGLPVFATTSNGLATAEVYDSPSGTFSQTGSLSSPRAQQTSVSLNAGTVLVTQGANGSSDEIYYSTTPLARHAYVPISSGNVVTVFDVSSKLPVATIPVGAAPFDAAVSPNGSFVYVDNSNSNSVSVIDPTTNTVVASIPVGSIPAGIAITPDSSTIYVATHGDNSVSVINAATNSVIKTVAVGSYPFLLASTPDGKYVYVPNAQSASVSVLSTATNSVIATIPVGLMPQAIAITPSGNSAYVTCTNSNLVYVVDTATNTVVKTIPVSNGPLAVSITPDGTLGYVSEYYGAATAVIDLITNTVVGSVPVGSTPYGSAITPDGAFVWQTSWSASNISVISIANNTVIATIPVPGSDFNVAITPK